MEPSRCLSQNRHVVLDWRLAVILRRHKPRLLQRTKGSPIGCPSLFERFGSAEYIRAHVVPAASAGLFADTNQTQNPRAGTRNHSCMDRYTDASNSNRRGTRDRNLLYGK